MRARALGLLVGAVLLALALRGVDPAGLWAGLRGMDTRWLGPVALIFLGQQGLRAVRQTLLVRALAPAAGLRDNLSVLCMSFLLINTLPGRVGELARPVLLRQRCGLPFGAGLAVVFLERLIDLGAALGMLWFTLMRPAVAPVLGADLSGAAQGVAVLVLAPAALLALGAAVLGRPALIPALRVLASLEQRWPLRVWGIARRGLGGAGDFLDGMQAARSPARLGAVLALTALTWAGTAWLYVVLGWGFGLGAALGWSEGVGVLAITMLGTALPAPPGMVGVYEAACRLALARLGVSGPGWDDTAMAYAVTLHGFVWAVQAATALWFFARDGVHPALLVRALRGEEAQPPAAPSP